jgi:hypothetical protein
MVRSGYERFPRFFARFDILLRPYRISDSIFAHLAKSGVGGLHLSGLSAPLLVEITRPFFTMQEMPCVMI